MGAVPGPAPSGPWQRAQLLANSSLPAATSAAPETPGPHALASPRLDPRGRLGEYIRSSEASVVRDAVRRRRADDPRIFVVRPAHNPVGPLDFGGGFDDRSDRRQTLPELMSVGYEDAYRQFVEPVVGAETHSAT